jgi:hypothetical protein
VRRCNTCGSPFHHTGDDVDWGREYLLTVACLALPIIVALVVLLVVLP